jgi:hypothetical protein
VTHDNTGGILLSDETGPTAHNRITANVVADNLSDCGITVAGHNPAAAPGGVPAPKAAGVYANVISGKRALQQMIRSMAVARRSRKASRVVTSYLIPMDVLIKV